MQISLWYNFERLKLSWIFIFINYHDKWHIETITVSEKLTPILPLFCKFIIL